MKWMTSTGDYPLGAKHDYRCPFDIKIICDFCLKEFYAGDNNSDDMNICPRCQERMDYEDDYIKNPRTKHEGSVYLNLQSLQQHLTSQYWTERCSR